MNFREKGFTLIEFLVVLLILVILISVLVLKFNFFGRVNGVELVSKSKYIESGLLDSSLFNDKRKIISLSLSPDSLGLPLSSDSPSILSSSVKSSLVDGTFYSLVRNSFSDSYKTPYELGSFFENPSDAEVVLKYKANQANLSLDALYGLLRPLPVVESLSSGVDVDLTDYVVVVRKSQLYDSSVAEYSNYNDSLAGQVFSRETIIDSDGNYYNGTHVVKGSTSVVDSSAYYSVNLLTPNLYSGSENTVSFEIKDVLNNNNVLSDGTVLSIDFLNSNLPTKTSTISNGKIDFKILFSDSDVGDINYTLSIDNKIIYKSISPLVILPSEDKSFTIDINKDVTIKSDGSVSFKPGTWTSYGKPIVTSLGEFYPGSSGGYIHPLTFPTATFELKVKSFGNDGYVGFNSVMLIRTGNTGLTASFYPDKVVIYDNPYSAPLLNYKLNGKVYHTYRLVKDNNKGSFYIDGKLVSEFTLRPGTGYGQYQFMFGDGTSQGGNIADTYFKDVKVAPGEALHIK